jgi:hypothetical protein
MTTHERWQQAQAAEREYWTEVSQPEAEAASAIQEILGANRKAAGFSRSWVQEPCSATLEIGSGA